MRYYVISDVHGYYTQMKSALEKAGFFSDTTPHKLIMLGDLFDRGHEAKQLQQFILEQMEQDKIILIRGNHEDLFVELVTTDAGMPYSYHKSNGTYDTALQLTGFDPVMASIRHYDFADAAKDTPFYKEIIPAMLDYFETEHYVFTHAINEAINTNKQISFQYFQYNVRKEKKIKRNGEPYAITPLHLVWNGDCYYMVGVYEYKQRLGSFRVDRIAKCPVILEKEGTPAQEGFDIDKYINTTFHMFNSEHEEVELICDNDVMDSIIDRFGEDVTTYANDMTSFRVVVNIAVSHVFYSWVFGFGGKVKIKGPENVKEKYAEMLRAAVTGSE